MGNNMTVDWNEQLKHQFSQIEVATIHHTLGQIDVYQYIPDPNVKIFSIPISYLGKKVQVQDKDYFIQKTKLKHPNLLRALALEKSTGRCHKDGELYDAYYDYPGMETLEIIMNKKIKKGSDFTEGALWDIIFQFVDCAEYLQQHYRSIGNINPTNIYALKDGIKLLDVDHLLGIRSSYQMAFSNILAILSPEQIDHMNASIQLPSINFFKSDVYAFGITLLCLTNKVPFTIFYQNHNKIDKNAILLKLQYIKLRYSELLHGLIQKMLSENPEQRQSWIDIKQFIQPFQILQDKGQPFYQDLRFCPQINPNAIPPIKLEQKPVPNSSLPIASVTLGQFSAVHPIQQSAVRMIQPSFQQQLRIPQVYTTQVLQSSIVQPVPNQNTIQSKEFTAAFNEQRAQEPEQSSNPATHRLPPQTLSGIPTRPFSEQPQSLPPLQSNNPANSTFQTLFVQPTLKQN